MTLGRSGRDELGLGNVGKSTARPPRLTHAPVLAVGSLVATPWSSRHSSCPCTRLPGARSPPSPRRWRIPGLREAGPKTSAQNYGHARLFGAGSLTSSRRPVVHPDVPLAPISLASIATCSACRRLRRLLVQDHGPTLRCSPGRPERGVQSVVAPVLFPAEEGFTTKTRLCLRVPGSICKSARAWQGVCVAQCRLSRGGVAATFRGRDSGLATASKRTPMADKRRRP